MLFSYLRIFILFIFLNGEKIYCKFNFRFLYYFFSTSQFTYIFPLFFKERIQIILIHIYKIFKKKYDIIFTYKYNLNQNY